MESLEDLRNRLLREERVQQMVRMRAYEIYKMRGGQPGWESHDWFQAEGEVLAFLIALETRIEDDRAVEETGLDLYQPQASSIDEAPVMTESPAIGEPARGKVPTAKTPKPRAVSKVTTSKPAKKASPKPAASGKSEPTKVNRTRKPSKQDDK